jgi:hypothetical protein
MTTNADDLVQPMTASMVPHPMYASGWNACLEACKEAIERRDAERLRAEVANWKADFARACEDRAAQANECKTLIAQLAELRERFEKAPVVMLHHDPGDDGMFAISDESVYGKRVRLVVED